MGLFSRQKPAEIEAIEKEILAISQRIHEIQTNSTREVRKASHEQEVSNQDILIIAGAAMVDDLKTLLPRYHTLHERVRKVNPTLITPELMKEMYRVSLIMGVVA